MMSLAQRAALAGATLAGRKEKGLRRQLQDPSLDAAAFLPSVSLAQQAALAGETPAERMEKKRRLMQAAAGAVPRCSCISSQLAVGIAGGAGRCNICRKRRNEDLVGNGIAP
eukprot:1151198-Pelagomonas_calceolata.AAC.1